MTNKVAKEDIETLDGHDVFESEVIVKIITNVLENVVQLFVISDKGFCYLYQVFVSRSESGKLSLVVESLHSESLPKDIQKVSSVQGLCVSSKELVLLFNYQAVLQLLVERTFNAKK